MGEAESRKGEERENNRPEATYTPYVTCREAKAGNWIDPFFPALSVGRSMGVAKGGSGLNVGAGDGG